MCRNGKKLLVVSLLLLVVFSPLAAAWLPFGLGKNTETTQTVEMTEDQQVEIQSLKLLVRELKAEIDASKAILASSQADLLTLREQLTVALMESEQAKSSLIKSEQALTLAQNDLKARLDFSNALNARYLELKSSYDAYLNAKPNPWGGHIGASGVYDLADGNVGVGIDAGVSYRQWSLNFSVDWMDPRLGLPEIDEIRARAGIGIVF